MLLKMLLADVTLLAPLLPLPPVGKRSFGIMALLPLARAHLPLARTVWGMRMTDFLKSFSEDCVILTGRVLFFQGGPKCKTRPPDPTRPDPATFEG